MKNISELFKTAKSEIIRKDRRIADLQRELDDVMFRRGFGGQKRMRSEESFERNREEVGGGPQLWKNAQDSSGSRRSPSVARKRDDELGATSSKKASSDRDYNGPHHSKYLQNRGRRGSRMNSYMTRRKYERRYVEKEAETNEEELHPRDYHRPQHWKDVQNQRENRTSPNMRDEQSFEECNSKRNRNEFSDRDDNRRKHPQNRSENRNSPNLSRIKYEQKYDETELKRNKEELSSRDNYELQHCKNAGNHKRSRWGPSVAKDHEKERQRQSEDSRHSNDDRHVLNKDKREDRSLSRDRRHGRRYESNSQGRSGNTDNKRNDDLRGHEEANSEIAHRLDSINYKESFTSKSENIHRMPKSSKEIENVEQKSLKLEESEKEFDRITLEQKTATIFSVETVTSQINIDTATTQRISEEIEEKVEHKTKCSDLEKNYAINREDTNCGANHVPCVNEIDTKLRTTLNSGTDENITKKVTPPAKRRRCVVSFKN